MFYLFSDGCDHWNSKDMSRIPHFVCYECSFLSDSHIIRLWMIWHYYNHQFGYTQILQLLDLISRSKFCVDLPGHRNQWTKHKYMVLIFVAFAINFVQPSQPKGGASYWSSHTNLLTKIHIRKQTLTLVKTAETNSLQSSDSIMLIARTPID